MPHGLDPSKELVLRWQWLPVPPLPLQSALPGTPVDDDAAFGRALPDDAAEDAAYRFSFPQLARMTPDRRFYRLMQLFNTPLMTVTSREAGRSQFAYWGGTMQAMMDDHRYAHFWFFRDQTDGDLVVLEHSFTAMLRVRSATKTEPALRLVLAEIIDRVHTRAP